MAQKSTTPVGMTEQIPASEHGTGFPPFNPDTFASQLVWLVLVFGVLYLLMARVALPRVGAIIDARRQSVEGDVAEAKRLKDSSDAAIESYEKALADARGRAQAVANQAHEKAAAEAEAARNQLDATLSARMADAEKAIANRRTAAMANVQDIAVETAAAIVERLTGQVPSKPDVAKAVAGSLKN
jgi:F-type H+-transporting ATPase subunit b